MKIREGRQRQSISCSPYRVETNRKVVNSEFSYIERKSYATTQKSNTWDAYCITKVMLSRLDEPPDANLQDIYWPIGQLVERRNALVKHASSLKNQLHQQLSYHYPSYPL